MWEEELLKALMIILEAQQILPGVLDSWCWLGTTSTPYAVKTAYVLITAESQSVTDQRFSWLWVRCIPLKIGAFCWRMILDRIPTYINLQNRGVVHTNGSLLCCFCSSSI